MTIKDWILNIFKNKKYPKAEGYRIIEDGLKYIVKMFVFVGKDEFEVGKEIFNKWKDVQSFLRVEFGERYVA